MGEAEPLNAAANLSETPKDITPRDRLKLANRVLLWASVVSVGVFISYGIQPANRALAEVFEFVKIGLLPLVTLVVSFYFQRQNN